MAKRQTDFNLAVARIDDLKRAFNLLEKELKKLSEVSVQILGQERNQPKIICLTVASKDGDLDADIKLLFNRRGKFERMRSSANIPATRFEFFEKLREHAGQIDRTLAEIAKNAAAKEDRKVGEALGEAAAEVASAARTAKLAGGPGGRTKPAPSSQT